MVAAYFSASPKASPNIRSIPRIVLRSATPSLWISTLDAADTRLKADLVARRSGEVGIGRQIPWIAEQLPHSAGGLVDRRMAIGIGAGIGVRDGDPSPWLSCRHDRQRAVRPERIPGPHILVGIAVGPPVAGDGLDVLGRIETALGQRAAEHVADLPLHLFEGQRHQGLPAGE